MRLFGNQAHAFCSGRSHATAADDAGTSAGAPAADQRGYARSGAVDIGAYEWQRAPIFGSGFDG